MHHKKFICWFVVWYCANTVNGSPISHESKLECGDGCTEPTEHRIRIEDHRKNHHQVGHFNVDLGEPKTQTLSESVALKRRKRQVDDFESNPDDIPSEQTSNPDPVDVVAQSPEIPEPPKNETDSADTNPVDVVAQSPDIPEPPKNETDSAEYKKAQENLLSASERVTDSKISSDTESSSDDKPMIKTETPPDTVSSLDTPKLMSDETPVKQDNDGETDTLLVALDSLKPAPAPTSEESTESKLKESVDLTVVRTMTEDGSSSSTLDDHTIDPIEPKSSDEALVKPVEDVEKDTLIPKEDKSKSAESIVETIKVKTTEVEHADAIAEKSEKTTEIKSKSDDKELVSRDDGNSSTSASPEIPTGVNSATDNMPNDLDDKVPTVPTDADSSKQHTTRKLDTEAETKPLQHLNPVHPPETNSSADTKPTHPSPSTPQSSAVPPSSENKANPPTEEFHKNCKESTSGDRIHFENEHEHHHVYDFDNFDEQLIEEDLIEDPCRDGCDQPKYSTDYDNVISHDHRDINIDYNPFEDPHREPCSDRSEYSTNYVPTNNYHHPSYKVEYGEPNTYDASRQFFDEVYSENDFDDLFDAEMKARRNHDRHHVPYDHFQVHEVEFNDHDDDHHDHHHDEDHHDLHHDDDHHDHHHDDDHHDHHHDDDHHDDHDDDDDFR